MVLSGIDADEYPVAPTENVKNRIEAQTITLPVETLRKMVTLVQFAAADDDSRPVLTGISVQLKNDTLRMAAADAFRLAVISEKIEDLGSWDVDLLIPAKSLIAACKQLPKAKKGFDPGSVTLTCVSKDFATFTAHNFTLHTRLIDGTFPSYMRLSLKRVT